MSKKKKKRKKKKISADVLKGLYPFPPHSNLSAIL